MALMLAMAIWCCGGGLPAQEVNQLEPEVGRTPDTISAQLFESESRVDAVFGAGPLDPLHRFWQAATSRIDQEWKLDLGLNYTALYQRAGDGNPPRDASAGDFDFFGRWLLLGDEDDCPGYLVFNTEARHRFSTIPPSKLGGNIGSVWNTSVGFGTQDYAVTQLYWERGSYDDGAIYRVGKLDPALIFDGGRYVSDNYAYLSPAFSDTLPMPLPGASLGIAAAIYPFENTYIVAGMHNANGKRTTAGFDTFFGEGEYFTAVEFGVTPRYGEPGEGSYHVTLWNTDARPNAGKQSDRGIALTLEQELGPRSNLVPFLRYAYAHRGINGVRENLAIGIGLEEPFGQNGDLLAFGLAWGDPAKTNLREQSVFETFYRIHITPYTHITPDLQVIIQPSNAPSNYAVSVLGVRFRTLY